MARTQDARRDVLGGDGCAGGRLRFRVVGAMILRRILGILSALIMLLSAFVAVSDVQRGIYMALTAIILHLWSVEE